MVESALHGSRAKINSTLRRGQSGQQIGTGVDEKVLLESLRTISIAASILVRGAQ
jgi:hypothetical protein